MNLTDILIPVGTLATLVVLPVTQLVKDALKATGWWVLGLSVLVGMVCGGLLAAGGIADLRGLADFPAWASGAVLGLLAGVTASGGKAVVTSVQENGAWARAKVQAKVQENAEAATSAGEGEVPPLADGWETASLDELGRTRTDWPAVPGVEPDAAPLVTK